jgi:hypothetical protein
MPKSREPCLVFWIVLGEAGHHADMSPLIGLLGAGSTRHRNRYTGDKRDELAALCMSGKQHSERRRGFGHDRLPVATGSPQALRIRNRE